jgi:hypothetical protein
MIGEVSYPKFRLRDQGKLFVILEGINLVGDKHGNMFEPVYRAFIEYWASPGMFYIMFPKFLLILMQRKPWIYIERIRNEHRV